MTSVRRLLVTGLVGTLSVVIAIAAGFSYKAGLQEAGEMFDAKLAHSARVLMSLVDDSLPAPADGPMVVRVWHDDRSGHNEDLISAGGHSYETKLAFQARDAAGRLLLRSDSGPVGMLAPLRPGFAHRRIDGGDWRVFTLRAPSGRWYQAAERSDIRQEIAADIAFGTLVPLLLALPVLAVMVWLAVCWASRGLLRVSTEIESREPDHLAPIQLARVPREVQGLVKAVNGLLARLEAALARDENERRDSQERLDAGVRRIERAITQLLALSRVEPGAAPLVREPVDLRAIVVRHAEDYAALAAERRIAVAVDAAPAVVTGDAAAFDGLVRNLVDNALRYTPDGGRVAIGLQVQDGQVRLVVEDSGPGIAPEARERVFGRFHRELGTGVEGSGLGLSIVAQVLESHGGAIVLDSSPGLGGLRASVTLPAR